MDLKDYEQDKFAIADILRSASTIAWPDDEDWQKRLRDLYARLAEDRFNLVVVGRFSRGKTSLMNAILGTDRLPTGIVPLTSVITTVCFGTKEQVVLRFDQRLLTQEVPIETLAQYITQQGNPGNVRRISMAEVQLRVEILRRGFYFVDTPGLGSAIAENTRTTESFLPEGDAFIVVTSYESPLSEEEFRFFRTATSSARRIFVVLNKQDLVSLDERNKAIVYVRNQLDAFFGRHTGQMIFSVSAREGLEAKQCGDASRLAASGIPALEDALVNFLVNAKRSEFLLRMCDRVADLIRTLPRSAAAARSMEQIHCLARQIGQGRGLPGAVTASNGHAATEFPTLEQLRPCEICEEINDALWQFLCRFQHDVIADSDEQHRFAEHGGLCGAHTWQYQSVASPYGICAGFSPLLLRLAAGLRDAASKPPNQGGVLIRLSGLPPTQEPCIACTIRDKAEAEAIAALANRFAQDDKQTLKSLSAVCLPHFAMLSAAVRDANVVSELMNHQATLLERVSEDMSRYALKHNATRRYLESWEETTAAERALLLLAGHRNVNTAFTSL
jgi:small GTP-binding protein